MMPCFYNGILSWSSFGQHAGFYSALCPPADDVVSLSLCEQDNGTDVSSGSLVIGGDGRYFNPEAIQVRHINPSTYPMHTGL
jgi:hypothetical protein